MGNANKSNAFHGFSCIKYSFFIPAPACRDWFYLFLSICTFLFSPPVLYVKLPLDTSMISDYTS